MSILFYFFFVFQPHFFIPSLRHFIQFPDLIINSQSANIIQHTNFPLIIALKKFPATNHNHLNPDETNQNLIHLLFFVLLHHETDYRLLLLRVNRIMENKQPLSLTNNIVTIWPEKLYRIFWFFSVWFIKCLLQSFTNVSAREFGRPLKNQK